MGKSAASWTIDRDILAWIDTKLGSKSQFVNRVLLEAMQKELQGRINREQNPRCKQWRIGGCGYCSICVSTGVV